MRRGKDNRSYPRANDELELWYSPNPVSEKLLTCSRDFSATGLSFISSIPFVVGTIISIELFLKKTDKVIKTRATVLRCWKEKEQNMVSVQFYDIDYHDFITILDYSLMYYI